MSARVTNAGDDDDARKSTTTGGGDCDCDATSILAPRTAGARFMATPISEESAADDEDKDEEELVARTVALCLRTWTDEARDAANALRAAAGNTDWSTGAGGERVNAPNRRIKSAADCVRSGRSVRGRMRCTNSCSSA